MRELLRDRYCSLAYRLTGRCWSQGCGRPMVLHGPWRLARCWAENTPSAIAMPGTDPAARPESDPAASVSHAASA